MNYFDNNHWRTLQALIWDHLQNCCIIWRPFFGKKVVTSKWFHNNKSGIKWKDGMSLNRFDKNLLLKSIEAWNYSFAHFCLNFPYFDLFYGCGMPWNDNINKYYWRTSQGFIWDHLHWLNIFFRLLRSRAVLKIEHTLSSLL